MLALSIQNLHKTYTGGYQALRGINLTVQQGEFYALLGANGAGKSTTLGIVSSLVKKTSGTVRIFDWSLDEYPMRCKRYLGLVPQEFNFNMWEPIEEILINQAGYHGIFRRYAKQRAEHCLKQLGLWSKRTEIARHLSGGMKRRLMIARALVHEPQLLILDEPTAGVDIEVRRAIWQLLTELNQQGMTLILTTHYLEEAEQLCKKVAIIDQGLIIEDTTVKQLLTRLQTETLVLTLAQPLIALPMPACYPCRLMDEHTLEVDIKAGQQLNELFAWLDQQAIRVLTMRTKHNRLETLFMDRVNAQSKSCVAP